MADAQVNQGISLVSFQARAQDAKVTQAATLVTFNLPSFALDATQGLVASGLHKAPDIDVTQAVTLIAYRGRAEDATLRTWTFSLDGHDFYVLRLGDQGTLIYDVTTEQWVEWASRDKEFWRPFSGMNWIGGSGYGFGYGSNIIAGDDLYGLLWVLDPRRPFDEGPEQADEEPRYFKRALMGQVPIRGRQVLPCYAAWLTTDMGDPAYDGASVKLEISDDAGYSFLDVGDIPINLGAEYPELQWTSLGQISAPGRLFKITDDGAVTRIDNLEMNDPDDE